MNSSPYSTAEGGVNYHAYPGFHTAPTLARNQVYQCSITDIDLGERGTLVSRRLNKRMLEKAPEGVVGGNVRSALFV